MKRVPLLSQIASVQLSKRKEFVLITAMLTSGLVATQLVSDDKRYWVLLGLVIVTIIGVFFGLRENIRKIKWLTLIILPIFFTAAVGLFYFLLPVRWLTRIPVAAMYAVGIYAILLAENIYSVAVNRSIQLLRVAHAVGFLISLVTIFLLLNTLFAFRLESHINMLLVGGISIPIFLQSLWSINLEEKISRTVLVYTLGLSLIMSQIAYVISFWPLKPIIISIFITTISYALLGIVHQHLSRRLFRQNIVEYVQVVLIVVAMILLTTRYR